MATQEEIERQKELNRLKQEQLNLEDKSNESLEYATIAFKNIVDEIRGGNDQLKIADQLQKSRVSSLTKSSNLARQLLEVAKGESILSKKQLDNISKKTKAEKANLERILQQRDGIKKVIDGRTVVAQQIKQEIADLDAVLDKQGQIEDTIKATNKALGLAPAIAGGFDKALQKAGFPALGISQAIEDTQKEAQKAGKGFNAMGTFSKKVAVNLKSSASAVNIMQLTIGLVVKRMLAINKIQTDFRRLTGESASNINTLNSALISTSDQFQTLVGLTDQFGFNANVAFDAINVQEATELRELMGLSAEEANNLAFFAQASGDNLKDAAANIYEGVSGGLSQKKILQDIGKVSKSIALSFGGNLEAMGRTAGEAKKLGLNLQQVDNIAAGLLDIESSIAKEFEAEVISGKQLNLEQARYFALTNDIEGLTNEIGKNQDIINSFATGNRIEQEATAAALGLSRDEVSEMIFLQKINEGISKSEASRLSGMSIEDGKRLTAQDSINKSIQKMTELLAGPLELLVGMVDLAVKFVDSLILGATTVGLINSRLAIQKGLQGAITAFKNKSLMKGIADMAISAYTSVAKIPFIGPALGVAAATAAFALGKSYFSKAGDMFSPADGKTQISTKEGGLFEMSPNDDIMAAPNLLTTAVAEKTPLLPLAPNIIREENRNTTPSIDYNQLADAIAMGAEKGTSRANITTNLDGAKVSNRIQAPLAVNTRKYSV